MNSTTPCIRHGVAGADDPQLRQLSDLAQSTDWELGCHLASLTYYHGQLWVTWKHDAARTRFAPLLQQAWHLMGGSGITLHLVPSDDPYDYQEDVMNDSDGESPAVG